MLSIIVPIYNGVRWLSATLKSLLASTYKDFELLLIDDGSTDDSLKIASAFACQDHRIKLFSKKQGGVSSARNYGIEMSQGEYVAFADQDDYVFPDFYETMMKEIQGYDLLMTGFLGGERKKIYQRDVGEVKCRYSLRTEKEFKYLFPKIDFGGQGVIWNKLFKKDILEKFHIRFKRIQSEDTLFVYEYIRNCSTIKSIDFQGYYFINNPGSQGKSHKYIADFDWIKEMDALMQQILTKYNVTDKSYLRNLRDRMALRLSTYILKGYYPEIHDDRKHRLERWENVNINKFFCVPDLEGSGFRNRFVLSICRFKFYYLFDIPIKLVLSALMHNNKR